MENFVVSARKYRPATFKTVVGQSHITNTLKNAIKNNHLAQAFLFCGPRGVGKTTCARILAKTINCTNHTEDTEACNECESCLSFNSGQSLNVYELDAASNNSVDDIRNLIDQVRFAPQLGQYKVYIIDEVHMLSAAAFNAFLKTLEEPPRHAIFILATTEKHKIIPTILSRCQIFDFNRIRVDDISDHLAYIAKSEGVTADQEALHVIAQKADGALRDACSIFDQMVSFAGNDLTYKAVIENLNVLDYDYYFKLVDHFQKQDISSSLLLFDEILQNGFDGHHFLNGLAEHMRNLLVSVDEATVQLLEVSQSVRDRFRDQAKMCSVPFLIQSLAILSKADYQYKASKNQRLLVELSLIQICTWNTAAETAEKKNESLNRPAESRQAPQAPAPEAEAVPKPYTQAYRTGLMTRESVKPLETRVPEGFSISSRVLGVNASPAETKQVAEPLEPVKRLDTPFGLADLLREWKIFAFSVEEESPTLHAILTNHQPEIREDNRVIVFLENKMQLDRFMEKRDDLIEHLREKLKNTLFTLEAKLAEDSGDSGKPLTPTEKFRYLQEKNPHLRKFISELGLDL